MIDLTRQSYEPSESYAAELRDELRDHLAVPLRGIALVELPGTHRCSDLFRALEQKVFDAAFGHIVPHSPDMMLTEYGPYERDSTFFAAVGVDSGEVLGALRVIRGFPNKTTIDLARTGALSESEAMSRYHFDSNKTWDIGSVAVSREPGGSFTGTRVSTALYRSLYLAALREEIEQWTSVIDARVLTTYHRLGIPFSRLADLEDLNYLGSTATACHLQVADIRSSMQAQERVESGHTKATIAAILHGSSRTPQAEASEIDLRDGSSDPTAANPSREVQETS